MPLRLHLHPGSLVRLLLVLLVAGGVQAHAADLTLTMGNTPTALKPLLSINAGPTPPNNSGGPDYTAVYQQLGVKMVRTHDFFGPLDMPTLYPDRSKDPSVQSSYNFTVAAPSPGSPSGDPSISSDDAFRAIVAGGFGVYFRVGDSAGNIKSPSDSERTHWATAAVQILKHYAKGQWNGFTTNIPYIEIGNEPDSSGFWTGSPLQFYQLYAETAKAIRAEFPTAKIGGPGITQGGYNQAIGQQWLNNFLDHVKANNAPLDFLSWHLYSNDASQFAIAAAYYRQVLDSKGFTAAESHVTEWNTEGSTTNSTTNADYRARAKGAAVNTATWMHLQEQRVDQAFFYRGSDVAAVDSKLYGLFGTDGSPKRSVLAFALWNELTGYANRYPVTLAGSAADAVSAMVAQRTDGAVAILVANTGSSSVKWTAVLSDGRNLANYALTLKTVDDTSPMLKVTTPVATDFDIAPGTTQLLLVHAGSNTFDASATDYGKLSKNFLALDLQAAAADVGQTRKVFLAANFANNWYLHNGATWQAWSGGVLTPFFSGKLPAQIHMPILNGIDATAIAGTTMVVGYGVSDSEMLSSSRVKVVYTLPRQ